jgi:hypothetical protein
MSEELREMIRDRIIAVLHELEEIVAAVKAETEAEHEQE